MKIKFSDIQGGDLLRLKDSNRLFAVVSRVNDILTVQNIDMISEEDSDKWEFYVRPKI